MASETPALDFAFGPRPQRQIDPAIAIMAQNFARQASQKQQADNALALQAQSERAADERQALALAANEKFQTTSNREIADRQLALENERTLNNQVAAEAAANKVRTKKYEEAAEYGFEVDPNQPPEVNEARADSVLQKADREAYKQVISESEKISKIRDEKLKEFQKGSSADSKTVSAYFLKSLAENPLLPKTVSSLLGKPEYIAAIKSGNADAVVAALKSKLAPADMMVLEGELAKAYTTAEAIAAEEWKDKSKVIIAEYERADSRQRELSDELKRMTSGWPARRFRERNEVSGGAPIPGAVQESLGLKPRTPGSSLPDSGTIYPDDRDVAVETQSGAVNEIAIPTPSQPNGSAATGILPAAGRGVASGAQWLMNALTPSVERQQLNKIVAEDYPVALGDVGRDFLSLLYAPPGGYARPEVRHSALPLPERRAPIQMPQLFNVPGITPNFSSDYLSTDIAPSARPNPNVIPIESILRMLPPPEAFTVPDLALPIR